MKTQTQTTSTLYTVRFIDRVAISGLTMAERLVLIYLARCAGSDGTIPSRVTWRQIADRCGLDERTARYVKVSLFDCQRYNGRTQKYTRRPGGPMLVWAGDDTHWRLAEVLRETPTNRPATDAESGNRLPPRRKSGPATGAKDRQPLQKGGNRLPKSGQRAATDVGHVERRERENEREPRSADASLAPEAESEGPRPVQIDPKTVSSTSGTPKAVPEGVTEISVGGYRLTLQPGEPLPDDLEHQIELHERRRRTLEDLGIEYDE